MITLKGAILNAENPHVEDVGMIEATCLHDGGPEPAIYFDIESIPGFQLWHEDVKIGGSSRYVMSWNEPDMGSQITPEDGAVRWRTEVEPRFRSSLVAPGVAYWGRDWIPQWVGAYRAKYGRRPAFSAINVHGYSSPGRDVIPEFEAALQYATSIHVKLWIGEYAALPDPGWTEKQRLAEAWRVIGWAMIHGVSRFFWFNTRTRGDEKWAMDSNAPLFDYDSGTITESGRLYAAWNGG